jgi:hypothetical protein
LQEGRQLHQMLQQFDQMQVCCHFVAATAAWQGLLHYPSEQLAALLMQLQEQLK